MKRKNVKFVQMCLVKAELLLVIEGGGGAVGEKGGGGGGGQEFQDHRGRMGAKDSPRPNENLSKKGSPGFQVRNKYEKKVLQVDSHFRFPNVFPRW